MTSVPGLEIREFRAGLLSEVVALWNRSAPADPITRRRFRDLILLDPNFDPAGLKLAFVDGSLAGATYAVRRTVPLHGEDIEPAAGWIVFFFVAPEHRGRGVARALKVEMLTRAKKKGLRAIGTTNDEPNKSMRGINAKLGYQMLPAHVELEKQLA